MCPYLHIAWIPHSMLPRATVQITTAIFTSISTTHSQQFVLFGIMNDNDDISAMETPIKANKGQLNLKKKKKSHKKNYSTLILILIMKICFMFCSTAVL